jgi:hypothetical protein
VIFLFLLYIGNKGSGFDPGSVNMQQANLGTSLNMFGGAKGGDPNKMDANSLMGYLNLSATMSLTYLQFLFHLN